MVGQQVLGGPSSHDELDAFGRVIERTIDSSSESFTYQGTSEALVQALAQGTATTFAQGPSGPIGYAKGNNTRLYIKDLHSDVVAETPASGGGAGILRASWYSPWGERESLDGSLGLLGFQGQPHTQLGDGPELVDMTTRYYQAGLGRFTTGDVLFGEVSDPMSLNRFAYAGGSPVTFTDPSGMCVLDETTGECYQAPTDNGGGGGCRAEGGTRGGCIQSPEEYLTDEEKFELGWKLVGDEFIDPCTSMAAAMGQPCAPPGSGEWIGDLLYALLLEDFVSCGRALLPGDDGGSGLSCGMILPWGRIGKLGKAVDLFHDAGNAADAVHDIENAGDGLSATAHGFGALTRAADFGVLPYGALRRSLTGSGLQAHHLIERRFVRVMGGNARGWSAIAVTEAEHQAFTNAWRRAIPYGANGTGMATRSQVLTAAHEIYAGYPDILSTLGL